MKRIGFPKKKDRESLKKALKKDRLPLKKDRDSLGDCFITLDADKMIDRWRLFS